MVGQKNIKYRKIYLLIILTAVKSHLKNQRIIVPTTLRSDLKSIIHQGHFGLKNLKKRARQALF